MWRFISVPHRIIDDKCLTDFDIKWPIKSVNKDFYCLFYALQLPYFFFLSNHCICKIKAFFNFQLVPLFLENFIALFINICIIGKIILINLRSIFQFSKMKLLYYSTYLTVFSYFVDNFLVYIFLNSLQVTSNGLQLCLIQQMLRNMKRQILAHFSTLAMLTVDLLYSQWLPKPANWKLCYHLSPTYLYLFIWASNCDFSIFMNCISSILPST